MVCGSGGSKSRLAKAAGAEPAGQMRDEKLHAVVTQSTFLRQNVQNTLCTDHFWKFRCGKSARRCGANQKRESLQKKDPGARKGRKVAKHCVFPMVCGSGESKSRLAKAAGAEPAGQMRDEKLHAVVTRSTFRSQNVQNTPS